MFWGDSDPVRGASSLRNALSVLKKDLSGLDDELITSDVHDVRLDIGRLWIDVVHSPAPAATTCCARPWASGCRI